MHSAPHQVAVTWPPLNYYFLSPLTTHQPNCCSTITTHPSGFCSPFWYHNPPEMPEALSRDLPMTHTVPWTWRQHIDQSLHLPHEGQWPMETWLEAFIFSSSISNDYVLALNAIWQHLCLVLLVMAVFKCPGCTCKFKDKWALSTPKRYCGKNTIAVMSKIFEWHDANIELKWCRLDGEAWDNDVEKDVHEINENAEANEDVEVNKLLVCSPTIYDHQMAHNQIETINAFTSTWTNTSTTVLCIWMAIPQMKIACSFLEWIATGTPTPWTCHQRRDHRRYSWVYPRTTGPHSSEPHMQNSYGIFHEYIRGPPLYTPDEHHTLECVSDSANFFSNPKPTANGRWP